MTIAVWALFGAVSCFAVYDSATIAFRPVAMWAANWTFALESAFWLLAPIMLCPALSAGLGWKYLRGHGTAGLGWRIAWFGTALAGLVFEPLLIWSVTGGSLTLNDLAGNYALIPLALLAGFLTSGAAMITMLTIAGRKRPL